MQVVMLLAASNKTQQIQGSLRVTGPKTEVPVLGWPLRYVDTGSFHYFALLSQHIST